MSDTKSSAGAVTWPVVIVVSVVAVCLTVLVGLDKDIGELVQLLLLLTTSGTLASSTLAAHKTHQIERNVNGKMTRLMDAAGVPRPRGETVDADVALSRTEAHADQERQA